MHRPVKIRTRQRAHDTEAGFRSLPGTQLNVGGKQRGSCWRRVFHTRAGRDKLADGLLRGAVRFCCDVIAHERFGLSCMRAPVAGRSFERSLHGRINRLRSALPGFDRPPPIIVRPRIHATPTTGRQSRSGICDLSQRMRRITTELGRCPVSRRREPGHDQPVYRSGLLWHGERTACASVPELPR